MDTHFLVTSGAFVATPGELDDEHEDYINPGIYALAFADFLEAELAERGYPVKFRCQEDWGHWIELEHQGKFTLAVCCANTGEEIDGQAEHRVFLSPDKPVIRKFFKKIDVRSDLEKLGATLREVLESNSAIKNVRVENAT
ncbi:MAG: hypothetical protein AAFP16_17455 [Pseudomonadota bacterium]